MINSEITDEGILIYKKIFLRHLKQLGLYNVIKKKIFHDKNMSFADYIRVNKNTSDVITSAVDVLWNVVEQTTHIRLKASLFLILVLTDERFMNIFTGGKNYNSAEEGKEIENMIGKEISYVSSVPDSDWKLFELNDALLFIDFLKKYKDGYFARSLKYKFDYVEGFKNEYWTKK